MFKDSSSSSKDLKEVETIIGQSVKVDGDFKSDGNVVIEGMVSGSLTTKGNVRVGEQAEIKANIEAVSAWIGGTIQGNLRISENLELAPSAKVYGDIETATIVIGKGAIINGSIKMSKDNQPLPLNTQNNNQKKPDGITDK